jgi:hypothetical protein
MEFLPPYLVRHPAFDNIQAEYDGMLRSGLGQQGKLLNPHSPDDAIICSVDAAIQLT